MIQKEFLIFIDFIDFHLQFKWLNGNMYDWQQSEVVVAVITSEFLHYPR